MVGGPRANVIASTIFFFFFRSRIISDNPDPIYGARSEKDYDALSRPSRRPKQAFPSAFGMEPPGKNICLPDLCFATSLPPDVKVRVVVDTLA